MLTLVTGASGHVGANLVRELLARGRRVRALVRSDIRGIDGLDVEKVYGDVCDPEFLKKVFKGVHTVFHCAACISVAGPMGGRMKKINIMGPRNIVHACLESGVEKLVHFSSIHAFTSPANDDLITEETPLVSENRTDMYDGTKASGQREILKGVKQGLQAVIVNPGSVIGPYDFKPSRMGDTILDLYHGRLPILVNGGYNWVDVRDVVRGALSAEEKGRIGEAYLLTGKWEPIAVIAELISAMGGAESPKGILPLGLAEFSAYFNSAAMKICGKVPKFTPYAMKALRMHKNISYGKAARELDYHPRPLEETVHDTLDWFGRAGMLQSAFG